MPAALLLRLSSQVMHAVMGGTTVFCLWYAAMVTDHDLALSLFIDALKWGGAGATILYFQHRYLDQ